MDKNTLRECLDRIGLTVADAALLLGVSERCLWFWLAGRPIPRMAQIIIYSLAAAMADIRKEDIHA